MIRATNRGRRMALKAFVGGATGALSLGVYAGAAGSASGTASVSFVVYLPTRPEAKERMRTMMLAVLDAMSKEPDFVRTWAHEDMNDPNMIVNYETWACSREYFLANHLHKPYRKAYEAALPAMLSGERRIVFLNTIRAYPGTRSDSCINQ